MMVTSFEISTLNRSQRFAAIAWNGRTLRRRSQSKQATNQPTNQPSGPNDDEGVQEEQPLCSAAAYRLPGPLSCLLSSPRLDSIRRGYILVYPLASRADCQPATRPSDKGTASERASELASSVPRVAFRPRDKLALPGRRCGSRSGGLSIESAQAPHPPGASVLALHKPPLH